MSGARDSKGAAVSGAAASAPNRTVLFLSNARQAAGDAAYVPGESHDPYLLASGLAAQGFRVKSMRPNDVPINPLANRGTFFAGFDPVRALRVLFLERDVDIVVSVGESNIVIILLLAKLLRFKPPIVLREISGLGWKKRDRIIDFVLPRVARVLALTPDQKVWAENTFRMRSPPDVVGFAIDDTFFTPQDATDGGYILGVGDDGGRDYDCLIAACRNTGYRLVLRTGSRPVIPDDMRDRVTIMGRVSDRSLRDLYAAASVVAVPLRQVDYPSGITTLYEAMAMGRPVVASDIGSTRHIVETDANGVLVPVGDPQALHGALIRLMDDAALRRRLGENARRTIEGEFSYAAYVNRFADSLRSVIASG
jgi:glycosyltransferase involved in cell wall biosynthesis